MQLIYYRYFTHNFLKRYLLGLTLLASCKISVKFGLLAEFEKMHVIEMLIKLFNETQKLVIDHGRSKFTGNCLATVMVLPCVTSLLMCSTDKNPGKSSLNKLRGEFRTPATLKMKFSVTLSKSKKSLTDVTRRFITDVAGALDTSSKYKKLKNEQGIILLETIFEGAFFPGIFLQTPK